MDRRKVAPRLESFGRWAFLIGAGIFATTLAQPDNLDLPLQRLLKDDLQTSQQLMAAFFALAALPWYLKPLAGLLSDTVPFFGTRRRYYLIWSAVFAAVLWFLVGHVPRSYTLLLCAVMATNAMLVVGSTIVGGLLVEAGPRLGAAGRLVAVQSVVESACTLVAGPLAGILAGQPFEVATAVGGSIALTVAPIAFIWLNEPATAKYKISVLRDAYSELQTLLSSHHMRVAALFLFFVNIPQEFQTPLFFYQTNQLRLPMEVIGYLNGISGAGAVLGAVAYGFMCRRLPLRPLLVFGIGCGTVGVLLYIFYWSLPLAIVIEGIHGFLDTVCSLALMEVAVWATPRAAAAMGFALLMSAWNAGDAIGDNVGAALVERGSVDFFGLVWIYAGATALVLCALPLLPRALLNHREGDRAPADWASE